MTGLENAGGVLDMGGTVNEQLRGVLVQVFKLNNLLCRSKSKEMYARLVADVTTVGGRCVQHLAHRNNTNLPTLIYSKSTYITTVLKVIAEMNS